MGKEEAYKEPNKNSSNDKKRNNKVLNFIMILALCIIIYGVWSMVSLKLQYKKADEEYGNLQKSMVISGEEELKDKPNINIDYEKLKKENPDTVGWLYYPCLNINYPIMQDDDNSFYIKHTFSGDKNAAGSIFLDADADKEFSDNNTFLYGHNMTDGSMFGHLKEIRDEEFLEENPCFWIYTEDGWHKYVIFSYHDAKKTDDTFKIRFDDKEEYKEFLNHIVEISEKNIEVNLSEESKIVSLSTCTSDSSVRFVVHGAEIK